MNHFLQAGERMRGRIPGLDGVRAVSVLIVMASHSGLQHIVPGVFGVTVFFFISGFLITTLLIDERAHDGRVNIGAFYLRRALRLYPPLLAFLGVIVGVHLQQGRSPDPIGVAGALFYFGNYLFALAPDTIAPFGAHLWSLAVEEHFYLVFPLIFAALCRRPAHLIVLLSALCMVALGLRIFYFTAFPAHSTYILVATETRFDSILFGCLTALLVSRPVAPQLITALTHPATVSGALLVIVVSLAWRDPAFRQTLRFTVQGLALIPLVLAAIFTPRYSAIKRMLNSRAFRLTGTLSYSLYLWHFACFDWAANRLGGPPSPTSYALGWLVTFLIAVLVHRLVEQPLLHLRRMFGSRAGSDDAPSLREMLKNCIKAWAPKLWVSYSHLRSRKEREIALLPLLVRKDCVAIDVGSHTGMYARPLARIAAHVHAFEPTDTFTLLSRAVPANVTVHRKAVSDRCGEAVLTIPDGPDATTLATLEDASRDGGTRFTVPVVTLDDLFHDADVGFVKIDVEGHEINVIKGAQDLIARCRPVFLIECEERHRPGALDWLQTEFARSGYRCLYLAADGPLTDVAAFDHARDQNPAREPYINNFIFLPPGHALCADHAASAVVAQQ